MANKIGFILSFVLFIQALIFCGDLIGYQLTISKLTSGSIYVCRQIEKEKGVKEVIIKSVKDDLNADLTCLNECIVNEFGMIEFKLTTSYQPLLLWIYELGVPNITIKRSVYIK